MDWNAMNERECDALVAEKVMGYTTLSGHNADGDERTTLIDGNGDVIEVTPGGDVDMEDCEGLPHYTTDRNAFAAVEEVLKRRGLIIPYMRAVMRALGIVPEYQGPAGSSYIWYVDEGDLFKAITAPLAIRCRAALRACGVEV